MDHSGGDTTTMKKYSMFHIPLMSFFSRELYRDVAFNWKGTGLLYLLFLLTLCWIPPMVVFQTALSEFVDEQAPAVINQLPAITISGGKASVEVEEPYVMRLSPTGEVFVIIDTSGGTTSLDDTGAKVLLTETKLIIAESETKTQVHDIGQMDDIVIDKKKVTGWMEVVRDKFIYVAFPLALFGSFLFRVIQALVYGGIGAVFSAACRVELPYGVLMRLSVVAVTPVIIVKTILAAAGVAVPQYGMLVGIAVALGYLYFGVKSAATVGDGSAQVSSAQG